MQYFEQKHLMLRGIELRVPYNKTGTRLTLELVPNPVAGDAIQTAVQFGSHFQDDLRRLKASNTIAWFMVTKGAFDTYLQAREVSESVGTAAGWELINNAIYTEPLNDFEVNRLIEPEPPRTPPPGTPRPTVALAGAGAMPMPPLPAPIADRAAEEEVGLGGLGKMTSAGDADIGMSRVLPSRRDERI